MKRHFILEILKVKAVRPDLVLCPSDEIWKSCNIGSSCRRGSQTRAREEGVPGTVIDLVNRWQKVERNNGGKPSGSMRDYYTEILLVHKRLLSYSVALWWRFISQDRFLSGSRDHWWSNDSFCSEGGGGLNQDMLHLVTVLWKEQTGTKVKQDRHNLSIGIGLCPGTN